MSEPEVAIQDLVRQTLEAAHWEYNQGIVENNPAHVLAFYEKWTAFDFEERDNPKGHVTNREEMLALMEQVVTSGGLGGVGTVLEATSTIAELVIEGNSAVAVVTNRYRYLQTDTQGWYGINGEEHEIEATGRWRETWVKTDQGWRFQISQMLSNQTYSVIRHMLMASCSRQSNQDRNNRHNSSPGKRQITAMDFRFCG